MWAHASATTSATAPQRQKKKRVPPRGSRWQLCGYKYRLVFFRGVGPVAGVVYTFLTLRSMRWVVAFMASDPSAICSSGSR